ncbi:MAG: YfhO family protein [Terriglobia bacterium]
MRNRLRLTGRDFWVMALLVASLAGMFWRVVFTSAMFFYRDIYNYTYPSARFIHELCRQGFLPYWNPYLNYGQPVLANPNLLFFYPYTLLIVLLPVEAAYTLHFLVHFALAGIGTYLLARVWGQTRSAAFFAAFVFMFSGPVLSLGDLYNQSACAAWIPWALLATDRALESQRLRPWVLLIVVFALQWLGGEPMTFLATFGLCFAYALYRCGTREKLWSKPNLRLLAIFFLIGCGILLLCAVQFLPASDLLSHSRRGLQGLRFRETANWAVNPFSLLEILIPDFFGSGMGSPSGWLWLMSDRNLPYFLSIFLGFVPLFYALAGWGLGTDRRRNFVAGSAGVFLLLSFGHFTPVFSLAYLLVPPLMLVRYPVKLLVIVTFLLAVLAGWGLDSLRSPAAEWKPRRRRVLAPLGVFLGGIVAVLAVAWLLPAAIATPTRWALHAIAPTPFSLEQMPDSLVTMLRFQLPGLAGFCLGGLVLIVGLEQGKKWARPGLYAFGLLAMGQLVMANYAANPTAPQSFFTYRPPVLAEFKDPPVTYRVTSYWPIIQTPDTKNLQTYISFESIPEAADLEPIAQGAFQARTQLAAGSMVNHVEGGINLDLERSLPPYLYDVEIYLSQKSADPLRADCLLGRTNVKYILRPSRADSAATRSIGDVSNGSPLPSRLYEDLCFVPRTYAAGNSLFTTDSSETLDQLASREFDAAHTVILAAPAGSAPAVSATEPAGQVEIVHRDPNSVTLQARLSRPAYVVLLERYDPSWQAAVDGRRVTIWRANQLFRAVYVEAGTHEIAFQYHQRGLRAGLRISMITVTMLLIICVKNPRAIGWTKAK